MISVGRADGKGSGRVSSSETCSPLFCFLTFDKVIRKPKHLKTAALKACHFRKQPDVLPHHEITHIVIGSLKDILWNHSF